MFVPDPLVSVAVVAEGLVVVAAETFVHGQPGQKIIYHQGPFHYHRKNIRLYLGIQ